MKDNQEYLSISDMNFITDVVQHPLHGTVIKTYDHLGGFDLNYQNRTLDRICKEYGDNVTVEVQYSFDNRIKQQYPNLKFRWCEDAELMLAFQGLVEHQPLDFKNFVCSFAGGAHATRKLLVAHLYQRGWFNSEYATKNFTYSVDELDGHIRDYVPDREQFYNKFFIKDSSQDFASQICTLSGYGNFHEQFRIDHAESLKVLQPVITSSFVHIVSETLASNNYPMITEKFLYSIVTRGLFVAYAPPTWHDHLSTWYGFKPYNKIFDYRFDQIVNPVERLLMLTDMLSKFEKLSTHDWHDLYEIEKDTIEFNYDRYFSKEYDHYFEMPL